jgi:hypothetical protein
VLAALLQGGWDTLIISILFCPFIVLPLVVIWGDPVEARAKRLHHMRADHIERYGDVTPLNWTCEGDGLVDDFPGDHTQN